MPIAITNNKFPWLDTVESPTHGRHQILVENIRPEQVAIVFDNTRYRLSEGQSIFFELDSGWTMTHTEAPAGAKQKEKPMRKLFEIILVNKENGEVKQSFQLAANETDACTGAILDAAVAKEDLSKWVQKARFVVEVPDCDD